jgi:hypothetical protein
MGKYPNDGRIRVQFVPTVADLTAPTVTELGGGTHITGFLSKDGLTTPADQNNVDVATLAENFNAQVPGSFGGAVEMTGLRDDDADTLWDLITYDLPGFIAVRRGPPTATAPAAAQIWEIYPIRFHEPVPDQTGGDEVARFTISAPVTAKPELKAEAVAP